MAKENVIVFDGEDKFIKPRKSVYSKTKGIAKNISANGEVISTSTTTQDTIKPLPIETPTYTSAVTSSQTTEDVVNEPPTSDSSDVVAYKKGIPINTPIQNYTEQRDFSVPIDDKLTGRGLVVDKYGNRLNIPIGEAINQNQPDWMKQQNPEYGSNPDEGAPNPTKYPFCPDGKIWNPNLERCVDYNPPREIVCEPGYIKNIDGICVEKPKLAREVCPEGYIKDENNKCVRIGGEVCPDGYVKDDTGICVKISNGGVICDEGFIKDANGKCIPIEKGINKDCPKGYVKDFEGICIPKKIDEGPKFPKDKNGDVIISQPNFGQPVGGGSGGGGGGSEETPTQLVKKNYFWLYILGAGILYMVLKKKSN